MKTLLLIFALLFLVSCLKQESKGVPFSEDYVLIEFASKLEEDYHKFNVENPNTHGNAPTMTDEELNPHQVPGNHHEK